MKKGEDIPIGRDDSLSRLLEAKKKRIQDDEEDQPSLWWRILVAM